MHTTTQPRARFITTADRRSQLVSDGLLGFAVRGDLLPDLLLELRAGAIARLQRDVHLDDAAADLVDDRDRRGLGNLVDGDGRRLELLGSEPVPGDVDDVVDAAQDPEVAIGGLNGS